MATMPATQKRPILYAKFTALPGQAETVQELLDDLARQVREEPGNILFITHRETEHADRFFVYEEYADAAAFEAHITASYGAKFNKALGPLIVEDNSQLTWLTRL
ncbi:Antibiotic biosynthesis monooxygenase (plasmid) [Pseudarthrobacter chlorophenolicus A6]|uniref:Antibiotic biosynthesis monooxygenase n=2 Tax=Micrococcales TaxID=85006 RepID=B8HJH0_PSECP|nr:Antibiotic biosynthesis monooxygenase [Pseudarthrobacter chlorophenolicus A6]SDQ09102.1 Quinol monooxygenase YgiN [Pseudarthrobacter chlorophenolicus]